MYVEKIEVILRYDLGEMVDTRVGLFRLCRIGKIEDINILIARPLNFICGALFQKDGGIRAPKNIQSPILFRIARV
jgi:hypothetical protein